MKKIKVLLPLMLAAVMLFTMAFAAACKKSNKNKGGDDAKAELQSISVDSSNVRKDYIIGEEFSSEGLVVTALIKQPDAEAAEPKTLTADEYVLDTSAYVKTTAGTYTIKVSYTLEEVTKEDSFDVVVSSLKFAGLEVKWTGNKDTFTLNSDIQSATIDIANIEVREVDQNGVVIDKLITDGYTVELYNGKEKVEIGDTTRVRVQKGGTYQIWVSMPSEKVPGYTLRGFARVYVINDMKSFAVDISDTHSVFTQEAGREDLMSSTWKYKITYANGQTEILTSADVTVENLNPKISGAGEANIIYNTVNAKGEPININCKVPFNITGEYSPNTLVFNASDLETTTYTTVITNCYTATKGDKSELTTPDELGTIEILSSADTSCDVKVTAGGLNMDGLSVTKFLDLSGKGYVTHRSIKLNLTGAAAVTVYAVSGSTSTERTLALMDDTFFPIDEEFKVTTTAKHTFMISEAGEYYLASASGGIRVYYILVEYD